MSVDKKFCKDCKHCVAPSGLMVFFGVDRSYSKCAKGVKDSDLVTGEHGGFYYCKAMRQVNICGEEAKLFEQKES